MSTTNDMGGKMIKTREKLTNTNIIKYGLKNIPNKMTRISNRQCKRKNANAEFSKINAETNKTKISSDYDKLIAASKKRNEYYEKNRDIFSTKNIASILNGSGTNTVNQLHNGNKTNNTEKLEDSELSKIIEEVKLHATYVQSKTGFNSDEIYLEKIIKTMAEHKVSLSMHHWGTMEDIAKMWHSYLSGNGFDISFFEKNKNTEFVTNPALTQFMEYNPEVWKFEETEKKEILEDSFGKQIKTPKLSARSSGMGSSQSQTEKYTVTVGVPNYTIKQTNTKSQQPGMGSSMQQPKPTINSSNTSKNPVQKSVLEAITKCRQIIDSDIENSYTNPNVLDNRNIDNQIHESLNKKFESDAKLVSYMSIVTSSFELLINKYTEYLKNFSAKYPNDKYIQKAIDSAIIQLNALKKKIRDEYGYVDKSQKYGYKSPENGLKRPSFKLFDLKVDEITNFLKEEFKKIEYGFVPAKKIPIRNVQQKNLMDGKENITLLEIYAGIFSSYFSKKIGCENAFQRAVKNKKEVHMLSDKKYNRETKLSKSGIIRNIENTTVEGLANKLLKFVNSVDDIIKEHEEYKSNCEKGICIEDNKNILKTKILTTMQVLLALAYPIIDKINGSGNLMKNLIKNVQNKNKLEKQKMQMYAMSIMWKKSISEDTAVKKFISENSDLIKKINKLLTEEMKTNIRGKIRSLFTILSSFNYDRLAFREMELKLVKKIDNSSASKKRYPRPYIMVLVDTEKLIALDPFTLVNSGTNIDLTPSEELFVKKNGKNILSPVINLSRDFEKRENRNKVFEKKNKSGTSESYYQNITLYDRYDNPIIVLRKIKPELHFLGSHLVLLNSSDTDERKREILFIAMSGGVSTVLAKSESAAINVKQLSVYLKQAHNKGNLMLQSKFSNILKNIEFVTGEYSHSTDSTLLELRI